jgi:hypothetical protein
LLRSRLKRFFCFFTLSTSTKVNIEKNLTHLNQIWCNKLPDGALLLQTITENGPALYRIKILLQRLPSALKIAQ